MKLLVIDTSILLSFPELLSFKSNEYEIWIPDYYADGYSTDFSEFYEIFLNISKDDKTINYFKAKEVEEHEVRYNFSELENRYDFDEIVDMIKFAIDKNVLTKMTN